MGTVDIDAIVARLHKLEEENSRLKKMNNQSFSRILIPRFTTFRNISSDDKTYTQIVETISKDEVRNKLIIDDVHKAIGESQTRAPHDNKSLN